MAMNSNRVLEVYHGLSPPRNVFELGIASEGAQARKAMRNAYRPIPRRDVALVAKPVSKAKEEMDSIVDFLLLLLVVWAFVAGASDQKEPSHAARQDVHAQSIERQEGASSKNRETSHPDQRSARNRPP